MKVAFIIDADMEFLLKKLSFIMMILKRHQQVK